MTEITEEELKRLDEKYSLGDDFITCGELRKSREEDEDGNKVSYIELSEELGVEPEKIAFHVRGQCQCDSEVESLKQDKPWTEKELLQYLLIDKNIGYVDAAKAFDCHEQTVNNWAGEERFDIMIIPSNERVSSPIVTEIHREGIRRSEELSKRERLRIMYENVKDKQ